ncbi:MAG: hypothetical protein RLZZ244_909 [Verrucomicrobiota bacterium]|jgi:AraC-like DNA-binding protein
MPLLSLDRDLSTNARNTRETILRAGDCPLLHPHRIAHVGWIETGAPFERVRLQPDGSYVLLCLGGEGRILLDGRWQRIRPGQVSLAPPRILNAFEAIPLQSWHFCWVRYAEPPGVPPVVSAASPVKTKADPTRLSAAIRGLISESAGRAEPRLLHLWIELIHAEVQRLAVPWQRDTRLGEVWAQVEVQPEYPWSAAELARLAHCSCEHLRRLCLRELGRSPMQHVTSIRIQKAANALMQTDSKLSEIAEAIGYSDAFVLSKIFKKWFGLSPAEYRSRSSRPPASSPVPPDSDQRPGLPKPSRASSRRVSS